MVPNSSSEMFQLDTKGKEIHWEDSAVWGHASQRGCGISSGVFKALLDKEMMMVPL